MAVPKRKTSKSRGRKRRTHYGVKPAAVTLCAQCGEPKRPHHACPSCGSYRGREVIEPSEV